MNTSTASQFTHLRIAEQGKILSLDKNYSEALRYYREAMRMLEQQDIEGKDLFFQHYSQCIMEALELSGSHEEVLNYCEKYMEFLDTQEQESDWMNSLKAHILEKIGIQYLLIGNPEQAKEVFREAQLLSSKKSPIADQFFNWLQRGYTINKRQVEDTLKRNNYYVVRKDTINPALAMELPNTPTPSI